MDTSQHNNTIEDDEITLKNLLLKTIDWYKFILSRWILISIFGILGGLAGFLLAILKKPTYIASTTFVLEAGENANGLSQYAGLASMVGIDIGGGGGGGLFQGDNILELYRSHSMIRKTLLTPVFIGRKRQLLVDRYIEFNELRDKWAKDQMLNRLNFSNIPVSGLDLRLRDSVLNTIVDNISKGSLVVDKPDKKLGFIKVFVSSKDELFSKYFNDQIVRNVNDFYIQTKTKKSLQNIKILSRKVDSVRTVMNGEIYSAAAVTDATPNLNPTRQVQRIAPVQRSQFSAETNKVILGELVKNLELAKLSLLKETPLIQVVDQPVFPLEKQKLGRLKGIVFGGVIAVFLTIMTLIIKRVIRNVIA